jgi:chromosome partitioning protein
MQIISIIQNKGGVAKSTTTVNLACSLARKGYKVALIDMDAQAQLSNKYFLFTPVSDLVSCLKSKDFISQDDFTQVSDNLWMLPNHSNITEHLFYDLFPAQNEIQQRHFFLAYKLSKLEGFDYVLIDTPPNLENRTINAILSSDYVLIPSELETDPIENIENIQNVIEYNSKLHAVNINVIGVVFTKVDWTKKWLNPNLKEYAKKIIKYPIIPIEIYKSADYGYASMQRKPAYFTSNKVRANFDELSNNIINYVTKQ